MHFGMMHEEYLELFIIMQNLFGIAAVVLIVRKFEYFVWFENIIKDGFCGI